MIEYRYTIVQWILFFFCYAFVGWIWECFFVSMKGVWKNKRWEFINRGFLHGPMIPIYGFAAISILRATLPFSENTYAIFIIGASTATIFEFVTGTVMERLFKVKYWDYSDLPLNYNGHICFFVSLFWGVFSVLLMQFIHVPVDTFIMKIPQAICEVLAFVLVMIFLGDTFVSFNEAMELRDILESLTENNETIKHLERRFDALVAFTPIPDIDDLRNIKYNVRENVTYNIERLRWKNEERINKIKEYILLPEYDKVPDRTEILEKLEVHRRKVVEKSNKQFMRAIGHLKRNPMVKSKKHQEIIELLVSWIKE